jgi:microcystin degradation protein MlrC
MNSMKRIAIAGFHHESNTFMTVPTTRRHFEQIGIVKGRAVIERWQGTHHELGGFIEGSETFGFELVPIMAAYATPGGTIRSEAFEGLIGELVLLLEGALPVDGVLLALHGAAVSEQYRDADGEIVRRLRQLLGPSIPMIMTLDLHANVSAKMVEHTTATVIYRSNPHLDQKQRGLEAASLMARTLAGEIRPVQAVECLPLIVNISRQYTQEPPARDLYASIDAAMTRPGILSASIAMGFPYADVEELGAAFVAVADGDLARAQAAAGWMASQAWLRRHEFVGELPSPAEAVRRAILAPGGPIVLMDVGDNVGGGGPGDSTVLFAEILEQNGKDSLTILFDPEAVAACVAAGVRQPVEMAVGAKTDGLHGSPVRVRGKVRTIAGGVFVETQVRHGGKRVNDQGLAAVVEIPPGNTLVLTSRRMQPVSLEQVLSLGIRPERKRTIVVKGVIAPRAAYEPIAREVILVDTPGVTSANPANFSYQHCRPNLFPLDRDTAYHPEQGSASAPSKSGENQ